MARTLFGRERTLWAQCFEVLLQDGTAEDVRDLLMRCPRKKKPVRFGYRGSEHVLYDAHWHTVNGTGVFTATVFKVRSDTLPSAVGPDGPSRLPIDDDTGVADPMCFAYDPVAGKAVTLSVANAARGRAIEPFLGALGFAPEVIVNPLIWPNMMKRLEKTSLIHSLTFEMQRIRGASDLRRADETLEDALRLGDSYGADNLKIELSMTVKKKESLAVDVVKKACRVLYDMRGARVKTLKLSALEEDDEKLHTLDLIKAQIEFPVEVVENDRQIDCGDCQEKLATILTEKLPNVR